MCSYCMVADHTWKYGSPWDGPVVPVTPANPPNFKWTMEQLKEYYELLKQIKALEDSIGVCPCPEDRGKPDYLKAIKDVIEANKNA